MLMTVGNLSTTVLSAIAMIIFSRFLGPSQFGVFSVIFSLLLILSKVGDAGINIAIQREVAKRKDDESRDRVLIQTGMGLKAAIIVSLAAIGVLCGRWISVNWLNIADYSSLVIWVFVLSGCVVIYEYINTILQAKEYFGMSVFTNFVQSALKLILAGALLFTGISLDFLTVTYLTFPLIGGLTGLYKLPAIYFYPRLDRKNVKTIFGVAKWTSIAIVAASLADNIDILLVQKFLTSYDTGIWSAAVRIASFAALISWSIGTVLNVRVAAYHDRVHLHAYLKKGVYLAIISFVGVAAMMVGSHLAIVLTVGREYVSAVGPLNLLFVSTAVMTATTPFVALFYLFDKPQYYAYAGIIQTVVLIGTDYFLIPSYGVLGAGWARIIVRIAVLLFTLAYARNAYRAKYEIA